MPIQNKDPLVVFANYARNMPRAELGGLLKEYLAESNHNGWDGFRKEHLTGIRAFLTDLQLYHENANGSDFANKQTSTNPVP